jgi:hypothetical protein
MRSTPPCLRPLAALILLTALACPLAPLQAAQTQKTQPGKKAEPAPKAEPVEVSGRIAVGLDKVFIKDAQGYCLVQGLDLAPFAGRHIVAKGLVIGQDQEYRTLRLLEYRIVSPDDDSPGASGAARQAGTGKQPGGSSRKK